MSVSKFESEVKYIPQDVMTVYNRFSDLRNLAALKEKLADPEVMAKMSEQVPADKMDEARQQLENMQFDQDSVQLSTPVGPLKLCVVERDEPKCIKFACEGAMLPLYLWIQLLPHGEGETKMRVTVGAEVNMFMKGMVSKPLQQAADGLANILSVIR